MMLRPSIDDLLEKVNSKYSLVVLEGKRAHELRDGEKHTVQFKSVKPTLQALEEIAAGTVMIHPNPEAKRETLEQKAELLRLYRLDEERRIKEQIEREQAEEEARQKEAHLAKGGSEEDFDAFGGLVDDEDEIDEGDEDEDEFGEEDDDEPEDELDEADEEANEE